MAAQVSRYNRLLLVVMVVLYVITIAAFSYLNWTVDSSPQLWMFVVNFFILSLPLVLFFGSIYVLVSAWNEHRLTGQISPPMAKIIHWAPRVAAVVIIFFVSLFSLDVFGMGGTFLQQIGAFILHSIPSIFLIVLLAFAWRRPVVGFVAFLVAGVVFLRFVIGGGGLGHFLLFSGPLLLIAALFYADWRWHQTRPPASLDVVA